MCFPMNFEKFLRTPLWQNTSGPLLLPIKYSERLKIAFFIFFKFMSNEIDTVFWESEAKSLKLFKSKIVHKNHFRKCLKATLFSKRNCLSV